MFFVIDEQRMPLYKDFIQMLRDNKLKYPLSHETKKIVYILYYGFRIAFLQMGGDASNDAIIAKQDFISYLKTSRDIEEYLLISDCGLWDKLHSFQCYVEQDGHISGSTMNKVKSLKKLIRNKIIPPKEVDEPWYYEKKISNSIFLAQVELENEKILQHARSETAAELLVIVSTMVAILKEQAISPLGESDLSKIIGGIESTLSFFSEKTDYKPRKDMLLSAQKMKAVITETKESFSDKNDLLLKILDGDIWLHLNKAFEVDGLIAERLVDEDDCEDDVYNLYDNILIFVTYTIQEITLQSNNCEEIIGAVHSLNNFLLKIKIEDSFLNKTLQFLVSENVKYIEVVELAAKSVVEDFETEKNKSIKRDFVGPKNHTVRSYLDKNGVQHYASVKDGKFSKSAIEKAKESLFKGEGKVKKQTEVELQKASKVLIDQVYNLPTELPAQVQVQVQVQAYAHSQANLDSLNAKAMLHSAVTMPIYSKEITGKFGKIDVKVNGPSASFELGGQAAVSLQKQVETSFNMKSMVLAGIANVNYTSPNMCVKDFCAQLDVALQAGYGTGIEAGVGSITHKTRDTTTNSTIRKVALGKGLMLGIKTKVVTSGPDVKYDNNPLLPPPYDNPMLCEVAGTSTEQVFLYREQFKKNTMQQIIHEIEAENTAKDKKPEPKL